MIEGKLVETGYDTASVQVVIAQSEEGEQLLLRDMKGTILVTPILPLEASRSPTPSQGDFDCKEGAESFAAEMRQLESVLQMLEEESMTLVELWQENRKQLIDHDL